MSGSTQKESYVGIEDPICAACRSPIALGMMYNRLGEKRYHAGEIGTECQATRAIDAKTYVPEDEVDAVRDQALMLRTTVDVSEKIPDSPEFAAGPRRKLRVYVAGASKEPDRCKAAMQMARDLGCEITLDWLAAIEAEGAANEGLDDEKRRRYARADYEAVRAADVIWVCVSPLPSTGSWSELGYAQGLRDAGAWHGLIGVSGKARERSIFAALSDFESDYDISALAWLAALVRAAG